MSNILTYLINIFSFLDEDYRKEMQPWHGYGIEHTLHTLLILPSPIFILSLLSGPSV